MTSRRDIAVRSEAGACGRLFALCPLHCAGLPAICHLPFATSEAPALLESEMGREESFVPVLAPARGLDGPDVVWPAQLEKRDAALDLAYAGTPRSQASSSSSSSRTPHAVELPAAQRSQPAHSQPRRPLPLPLLPLASVLTNRHWQDGLDSQRHCCEPILPMRKPCTPID